MFGEQYLSTVRERIGAISEQRDAIRQAAELIVRAVNNNGGVYIADIYGTITADLVDRASTLALCRSYDETVALGSSDILMLAAYHPDDPSEQQLAEAARNAGAGLIVIGPDGALADSANIWLSNGTDATNGTITLRGILSSCCPASGIVNAALAWSVATQTVSLLLAEDMQPSVIPGEYLINGRERAIDARRRFTSRGY